VALTSVPGDTCVRVVLPAIAEPNQG